jgi:hypothetical protein
LDQPPQADLEQNRQHDPQQADAQKLEGSLCGDPPDGEARHGEDEERTDGDTDLSGREVADEGYEQHPPQDAVDRLDGDDDQPDGEGSEDNHRRHPSLWRSRIPPTAEAVPVSWPYTAQTPPSTGRVWPVT